jgi:hypothetical protein
MIHRFLFALLLAAGTHAIAQPCFTVPSLNLVSRTPNSITVSTGSTSAFHRLEYGPLGFTPGSGTLTPWFATSSYVVNGLSGSTGYDFYIRDSCSNGSKSLWSSFFGYSTTCGSPASIPWVENFDQIFFTPRTTFTGLGGYMCGWDATPNVGFAWVSAPPFQSLPTTGPQSDHSGRSKYLFADRFGAFTGNTTASIRTPQINLTGASVPVVEFWYHMYGNQIDSLVIEATTVGNTNWVRLGAIANNPTLFSSKTSPWQQQVYPLTMFTNQTVTIRFVAKSSVTFPIQARVAIDDLRVGQATGCVAPSNLNFSGILATSATAGLVNGSSTHHQLSYGAVGTGAGNGTLKRFSGTSTPLTGLTPNTTYEAWVRDSCGPTSFSGWVGPVQFTTACVAVPAPWSESFDGFSWTVPGFNQAGTWPSCWNRPTNSGMTYLVGPPQFSSFNTGPSEDHGPSVNGKFVYLESVGFTNGTSGTFRTPWINLSPLAVPELTFWYHAYGFQIAGTQLHVEDTAGVFTLVWSSTGQIQTAQTDPWSEVTVSLAAFANKKVRLRWTGTATGNFASLAQSAIDDIDIHATPSCPKPQNLGVTTTNSSSVTLNWTVGSSPWVVKYGPVGFNPSLAGTRVVASSNPFTVTGLSPNTTYQFYVKDTCGPTSVSAWSTPVSATTTCVTLNAPVSEPFQSSAWTAGTWPNLEGTISACWSRSAGSSANEFFWTVGQGAMQAMNTGPNQGVNGGKYMFTSGFGNTGTNQALLTSPWINTTPLNVPMLRFSSHLFAGVIDRLQVFVDSGSGWQSILIVLPGNQTAASSAWTLHEIQLPAYADKTVRFRFRGEKTSVAGYAEIGLDEFAVVEAPLPSCSAPSALSASGVTVNTAQVGFTPGSGSTRIALGAVGFVPTNAAVVANAITSPHILTGLTANTTYHVYLKDTCAPVGLASSWVGPLAFTTQPCPPVSASFTYNVVGGNLIMNAQNISATSNYAWTLVNSSGATVATRTGGSSTISVSGTGSFTLSLIVTNFCGRSDTAQATINICAPLGGGFSHTVNGNTVNFTSLAVNSSGQLWDFGDGNQGSGATPTHTYAGSGSYTVTMRSYNICGDTITSSQVVTTCSKPTAEWTAQILSSGGAGMRVQFNATPWSSVDAVNFQWLYGDGTTGTGANPIKVYGVPGLFYTVTLIATNSCGGKDTLTKSLQTVGLDEPSSAGAWFPNPAERGQWITSPSDVPVRVASLTGQLIGWTQRTEGGKTQVQVPADCPAGVYILWQDGVATRVTVP